MKTTITELKAKLESPSYGGRVTIEGELTFIKKRYSQDIEVYHNSNPRGGNYPIDTLSDNDEIQKVLEMNEQYIKDDQQLKEKGFKYQGKGLYSKKDSEGNWKHAMLYWGETPRILR